MRALLHAAVPLLGLAVNVALQLALVRARGGAALLRSLLEGFAAGLAATLGAEALLGAGGGWGPDRLAFAAANALAYGALGFCYFNFVNLGVTARRPRILIELRESPAGLTYAELLHRYDAASMVAARLERLVGSGQVRLRSGRYVIGRPVMLRIAQGIVLLKRLVLGRASEFDD